MSMLNWPLVLYVLKASVRDKLIISLLVIFVLSLCLSIFIGSSVVIEADQAVITFIAASARMIGVFALSLFTVFYIRRAFETHDIEYLLSRPITRPSFVISHALALSFLSMCLATLCAGGIYLVGASFINIPGFVLWTISLGFEFIIVVNAAFFFSMVLSSAVSSTLSILSAYVFARMSGPVLGIIDTGEHGALFDTLGRILEASSVIVPRLDLFAQSAWLMYGPGEAIGFTYISAVGIAFTLLILSATLFDLIRREF